MRTITTAASVSLVVGLSAMMPQSSRSAEGCALGAENAVTTSHYRFVATSTEGAVGDVVPVHLSLVIDDLDWSPQGLGRATLVSFHALGCYDPGALEILGAPRFSDVYDELTFLTNFYPAAGDAGRPADHAPGSFLLSANVRRDVLFQLLSPGEVIPLATLFFRVTSGIEGQSTEITFAQEFVRVARHCELPQLYYTVEDSEYSSVQAISTTHEAGAITILPGPPTRTEPPPLPPEAKVYDEAPTPETAEIRFALEAPLVTYPGARDLPVDLYVTSNFEFSGFMTGLRFQPEYLELRGVEEHTRPGIVEIDNAEGGFGVLMSNSNRRVGREGERVHLATLHFAVKEEASSTSLLELALEPFGNFFHWVAIQHSQGTAGELPAVAEVEAVFVGDALVRLQEEPTYLGDADLDYEVALTDAVVILDTLFRGQRRIVCEAAADFTQDGQTNISDPIALLLHLFNGGPPSVLEREVFCDR